MHRHIARALLLSFSAFVTACATPPLPAGIVDSGFLVFWEIRPPQGEEAVAHLLGSIHLGRERIDFDPAIRAELPAASMLVYEIAPGAMSQQDMAIAIFEMGRLPDDQSLENLLSTETWKALSERLEEVGLPAKAFAPFEPWVVMLQLIGLSMSAENLDTELGVEHQISRMAKDTPAIGLETPGFQIGLFDALPMDTQIYLLEDALESETETGDILDLLFAAWQTGDLEMLERLILPETEGPQLELFRERVFMERNRNMAEGIADLLTEPGHYFVTLGAGHTIGVDGIPSLLGKRGFRVRRIPRTGAIH
ncbi:MAG: TraB/GumN family protein [bacterium]|nr:TraB/GumN family protein [bacterium]